MGKIAGFFPIGDTGDQFVVAEWHPDPEILEAEILKMAASFDDWTVPLQETKQLMIENTKMLFEEERDPYWRKWVPLETGYEKEKSNAGYGDQTILRRTNTLYFTATHESSWFVTQDAVFFNSAALPEYGAAHQEGTESGEVAEVIRALREGTGLTRKQAGVVLEGRRGKALPQRMFIGATEGTIADIEAVFLNYIRNTIETPWRKMGRGVSGAFIEGPIDIMGTNVLGMFPVMNYLRTGQPILRTPRGPRFGRM